MPFVVKYTSVTKTLLALRLTGITEVKTLVKNHRRQA